MNRPNPLRVDPTRTTDIRKRFAADVRRRFDALRADILDLVVKEDAFGLSRDARDPFTGQGSSYGLTNAEGGPNCGTGAGGFKPGNKCARGGAIVSEFSTERQTVKTSLLDGKRLLVEATQKASETDWLSPEPRKSVEATIDLNSKEGSFYVNRIDALVPRRGYAAEVLSSLLEQLFERGFSVGTAYVEHGNDSSSRMMLKLGGKPFKDTGKGTYYRFDPPNVTNVENLRWIFSTASEKVKAFLGWIKAKVDFHILGTTQGEQDAHWWDQYLKDAMLRGRGRAFDDAVRKAGQGTMPGTEQSKMDFLRGAFSSPLPVERAKQLAGRVLTDLKGVTEAMATDMSRTLLDGLARGDNPRKIGQDLTDAVDGIGKKRGELIARTEVIRAHAEGQLDGLQQMGVEAVSAMVEWSTAGDARVCPLCAPLEGTVLLLPEARGLIPRHPNCRCSWLPANVGESTKGQKRSLGSVGGALIASIKAESKRGTVKERIRASKWAGAGVKLSKRR